MANRTKATKEQREQFLAGLIEYHGNVSYAAAPTQIGRQRWYEIKKEDPEFSAKWDAAVQEGLDRGLAELEPVLFDRAKAGSDKCLLFALERLLRKKYGPKLDVEHGGTVVIKDYTWEGKPTRNEEEAE
jgi:hypothetical protein